MQNNPSNWTMVKTNSANEVPSSIPTSNVLNYGSTATSQSNFSDEPPLGTQTQNLIQVSPLTRRIVFICAVSNTFLSSLDSTLVSTLLTTIASDLEQLQNISWVATSYLLSCAAFQPLFGKLSNVFGRKVVILWCTFMFAIGCLICGLSTNLPWLVVGRFITGIGGGGFNTMSSITISDVVDLRQRGLYQGYVNIFFQLGAASGGLIAGLFESTVGWRVAFLIQVPACFLTGSLVYFCFKLPAGSPGLGVKGSHWVKIKSLDFFGSFLLVISLFSLMIAISMDGNEIISLSPRFVSWFVVGSITLVIFYFYDLKYAVQPIIPVTLLHNRTILSASLGVWFISMTMFSAIYYLPFYWQSVKGLTPLDSGLRLIPSTASASFSSIFAGYMMRRTSTYRTLLIVSGWVVVVGSIFIFSSTRTDLFWLDSFIGVPLRFGTGSIITAVLIAMISCVSFKEQALVTSISYAFRSTGSTLGVSLASAVLQFTLARQINSRFDNLINVPDELVATIAKVKKTALENPGFAFTNKCPEFFKKSIIDSYDYSGHAVFIFVIVTGLASIFCLYFVEDHNLNKEEREESEN